MHAFSGEEALEVAHGEVRPDLILLDVTMPGLDGYETCAQLKARETTASIPVVFLTALDNKQDEAVGFEVGAIDYIAKPIVAETVKARIHAHMELVEAQAKINRYGMLVAAQKAEIAKLNDVKKKLMRMVRIRDLKIAELGNKAH